MLCRFCIADLAGQPAPPPPIDYRKVNNQVETTTDDDGIDDDFSFEDEVMYA